MKRDARIGLAVVLVLGLAVTLLVGRALYKRGTPAPSDGEDIAAAGDAPSSTDPASAAASANAPAPINAAPLPETGHTEASAAHQPETPGLKPFIEDERRRITPATSGAELVPAPITETRNVKSGNVAPEPAGDHNSPAANSGAGWEDHEGTPADASNAAAPADGYGYTVQAGDNPWKISSKVYGDGKYTQKIAEANPGLSSQKMKVGMVIKIPVIANKTVLLKLPSFAEAKEASANGTAVARHQAAPSTGGGERATASMPVPAESHVVPAGSHKVEAGETLGSIAKKYYGTAGPKTIAMIMAANKGLEPTRLRVGQEIVLPAKK